jgi:hypothetical protein
LHAHGGLAAGKVGPKHHNVMERTDAQRWADAESILDGDPSEFAVHQLSRYRRRLRTLIWSLVAVFLITAVTGVVVIVVFGHHHHHATAHTRVPLWQEIAGLIVQGAGLVFLVVGFAGHVRSGGWRDSWRSPAMVLTWAQRRELSAQIRGRAPLDPDRARVARHVTELAAGPRARRFFAFLFTGIVLELIGQMISTPSTGRVIYTGAALVVYAVLVVFAVGRQRQMRAFLEQTRSFA